MLEGNKVVYEEITNGTQIVSYIYDIWGKLISIAETLKNIVGVKNPYRYIVYKYDTDTGYYYLQSCCYNPEWVGLSMRMVYLDKQENC